MLAYFERVNTALNARFFSVFGCQQRFLELIRARLRSRGVVLDLGVGSVDGSRLWAKEVGKYGSVVIACDRELEPLARNPNPQRLVADAACLPFPDATVDLIITDNMFEHLTDPGVVLSECRRILTHGGALIFATPHKYS